MTHYYLYIKAGTCINADTRFYKVGVGESAAQRRYCAWLSAYAAEHGHLFVLWSTNAADFFVRCCQSIGSDAPLLVPCKAAQLVRWLGGDDDTPAMYQAELHRRKLLMQIDPRYYTVAMLNTKNKNS